MEYIKNISLDREILKFRLMDKNFMKTIGCKIAIALSNYHKIFEHNGEYDITDFKENDCFLETKEYFSKLNLKSKVSPFLDFNLKNMIYFNNILYLIDFPAYEIDKCISTPHMDLGRLEWYLESLKFYPQVSLLDRGNIDILWLNFLKQYQYEMNIKLNSYDFLLMNITFLKILSNFESNLIINGGNKIPFWNQIKLKWLKRQLMALKLKKEQSLSLR
jgi:hypothetical protein